MTRREIRGTDGRKIGEYDPDKDEFTLKLRDKFYTVDLGQYRKGGLPRPAKISRVMPNTLIKNIPGYSPE